MDIFWFTIDAWAIVLTKVDAINENKKCFLAYQLYAKKHFLRASKKDCDEIGIFRDALHSRI